MNTSSDGPGEGGKSRRSGVRRRHDVRPVLRVDDDQADPIDDELAHHLEVVARRLMDEGMDEDEARRAAEERFGNVEAARFRLRSDARRARPGVKLRVGFEALRQDVSYALRGLGRRPGFAAVAITTLAVGIGGVGAAFTLLDGVLLRPLPFREPERVVRVLSRGGDGADFGPGYLGVWRDEDVGFEAIAGAQAVPATLTGLEFPVRLEGLRATASIFGALGVAPELGRGFTTSEDVSDGPQVVLLSHRVWVEQLFRDPAVIGSSVLLNGVAREVIGILPESLDALSDEASKASGGLGAILSPDFVVPLQLEPDQWTNFGGGWMTVVGRLADGLSPESAASRLSATLARNPALSTGEAATVAAQPLRDAFVRPARGPLTMLMGGAAALLLLACLNLANLTLAQGTTRVREMAIRASLGAGGGRLVRQLLVDSLVLSLIGGVFGLVLSRLFLEGLLTLAPPGTPRISGVTVNMGTALFCLAVSTLTGVVFGLLPALRVGRLDPSRALRDGAGSALGGRNDRTRNLLVLFEVAMAVVLLIGSGLLLRSAVSMAAVARGFDAEVMTAQVTLPWAMFPSETDVVGALDAIVAEMDRSPEIDAAGYASRAPFVGNGFGADVAEASGDFDTGTHQQARLRIVSTGYPAAIGWSLEEGRALTAADDAADQRRVLVNRSMVTALGMSEPIGRYLKLNVSDFRDANGEELLYEIVGVVGDVRDGGPRVTAPPEVFFTPRGVPAAPWDWIGRELVFAGRAAGDASALAAEMRRAVAEATPGLPVYNVQTTGTRDADALAAERLTTALVTALGLLSLILAVVGIYGVVSYLVVRRTREMGLRMALGSSARGVGTLVLRQTMAPVLGGVVVGSALAAVLGSGLSRVLYGVSALDPLIGFGAVALVTWCAALASWVPARRASRIDPMRALKAE